LHLIVLDAELDFERLVRTLADFRRQVAMPLQIKKGLLSCSVPDSTATKLRPNRSETVDAS
jgi:hypothetical protein